MDGQRFDRFAKALAQSTSRRAVLRALAIAFGAGMAPRLGLAEEREKPERVVICHKGRTIRVSPTKVERHLAHGDVLKVDCCNDKECDGSVCVDGACACPPGSVIVDGVCCTPARPEEVCSGLCGSVSDGCGGTVDCGECKPPETCGGGGTANACGCTPNPISITCQDRCGTLVDNCGREVDCRGCRAPDTCGGGGTPNVCGCTPATCADLGIECGSAPDGCVGTVSCGECPSGEGCFDGQCAACTPATGACTASEECCSGPDFFMVCRRGACCRPSSVTCGDDTECCSGSCVDGQCSSVEVLPPGSPCEPGLDICADGDCVPVPGTSGGICCSPIAARPAVCDGICTDLAVDRANCGECGRACREDLECGAFDSGICCNLTGGVCRSNNDCCVFFEVCVNDVCCKQDGQSCDSEADCCSGRCENGSCACAAAGEVCEADADCCGFPGLTCQSGRCCVPSEPFVGSCTSDAECCSGSCLDGFCAVCDGDSCCRRFGSCASGDDCCNGLCIGGSCTCVEPGDACDTDAECCGGSCRDGTCCISDPSTCVADVQCCSGVCDPEFGICACARGGEPCAGDGDCCDLRCDGGMCACGRSSAFCLNDDECCSGVCRQPTCD